MSELFKSKDWIGEFFTPDQYEKRFPGKVTYSAESGVMLEYAITGHDVPDESPVLFGILDNGQKCTLVGKFRPVHSGVSFHHGLTTRKGRNGFQYLLVGDFIGIDEKHHNLTFTLTNLQEFFFPKGYKDLVKYSEEPIFSLETSYGKIEVGNTASFGYFGKDITSQIYSMDKSALEDLKNSFAEIQNKYPKSFFMLKKDIGYNVRLEINDGGTIHEVGDYIYQIANLFALLIYSPVYPESINISKNEGDKERHFVMQAYPSMVLEHRTIEIATKDRSHFHMPITQNTINLPTIIESWLLTYKDYSTIISSIQHETGFRDEHAAHGEIVLYATQLESISYSQNIDRTEKYEYPINTYGSEKVKSGLIKIFEKINSDGIGKNISELRNEIAHVSRPKRLLPVLSLRELVHIEQYLHIIIIAYILGKLGISKEVIDDYQNKFTSID